MPRATVSLAFRNGAVWLILQAQTDHAARQIIEFCTRKMLADILKPADEILSELVKEFTFGVVFSALEHSSLVISVEHQ